MARKDGKDRGILQRRGRKGWWVRFYVNGREKWERCDTKSQAKALYGRRKAEQREGKYFEKPKTILFREIADEYLQSVDARRPRVGDDAARMGRWVRAFGDQDANMVTVRQIEQVLTELRQAGRRPATLVRHVAVLKAAFNRAKSHGLVKDNPAERVSLPKVNNEIVRYLTADQETELLEALPEQYRSLVTVALHTGLRQGELLALQWSDIDWNAGIVTVQQTKAGCRLRIPMNSVVVGRSKWTENKRQS